MKKYLLILVLIVLAHQNTFSQEKKYDFNFNPLELIDSFKDSINLINNLPESKDKAYLYLKAASYYFYKNGDSAIYFSKKAEEYTKSNDFKLLQVNTHLQLAQIYVMLKSNYSLALYYSNLAKKEQEEFKLDFDISEWIGGIEQLCYEGLGSYSKVKKVLDKSSATIMEQTYASKDLWNPVAMLAGSYNAIKEYDSAIKYGLMAVDYNRKAAQEKKYGFTYYILSDAFVHKKEYQQAINYLREGFPYLKKNNIYKDIAQAYGVYAQAFFGLKQYDSAIYFGNIAFKMANQLTYTIGILKASELLSNIYEEKKQTDSAYKYLKITNEIKDVLSDKSKVNEIENITLNEELRQKQKEEEESRRKKLIIGFSLFFIIGFTSYTIYNRQARKERARKREEDRKNNELKAARDLQLSMLPKQVPQRSDLDIAAFIRSSTEVGGDYYDFFPQDDGSIYSVCGDATGHGVTSGMMVSVTKAGLNGIDAQAPNKILERLNKVVKKIDLGTLRMSLNIAQINISNILLSSAAMPPIYLYKAKNKSVLDFMNNGLPLGGLKQEQFIQEDIQFEQGDVLVQLSDGLPEAPNLAGDMYDYDRLKQLIQDNGHNTAQGMIDALMASVDEWLQGQHNPDDITLVVTKKK
jgi:serine phosphatase RsbU (regulator of sigma subunit)